MGLRQPERINELQSMILNVLQERIRASHNDEKNVLTTVSQSREFDQMLCIKFEKICCLCIIDLLHCNNFFKKFNLFELVSLFIRVRKVINSVVTAMSVILTFFFARSTDELQHLL